MVGPVAGAPDRIDIGARRLPGRIHVGELALHQLEVADRLAELFSLVHVGHHGVHAGRHDPERAARQHRALVIEAGHQHLDALADLAEHVLLRHLALVEEQRIGVGAAHAELVEMLAVGEPLEALFDQEGGHAARARLRIGLGIDDQHVGVAAIGDPHLRAVEHVTVAALVGAQLHRNDVGARAGLGHRERADIFAADQLWQIARALRVVAVAADLVDAEVGMGAVG
ncbi:hypothetical protein ACVWZR_008894 [Bradyrhizobium sp. i1.3.1]